MKTLAWWGLCALVVACRGEAPATAADAAIRFYTMREAVEWIGPTR